MMWLALTLLPANKDLVTNPSDSTPHNRFPLPATTEPGRWGNRTLECAWSRWTKVERSVPNSNVLPGDCPGPLSCNSHPTPQGPWEYSTSPLNVYPFILKSFCSCSELLVSFHPLPNPLNHQTTSFPPGANSLRSHLLWQAFPGSCLPKVYNVHPSIHLHATRVHARERQKHRESSIFCYKVTFKLVTRYFLTTSTDFASSVLPAHLGPAA